MQEERSISGDSIGHNKEKKSYGHV